MATEIETMSQPTIPSCNKVVKKRVKNVLRDSNKVNKKVTAPKNGKANLILNQSTVMTNSGLREKISKLASEEDKGLKYISFQEFEQANEIQKSILSSISKSKKIMILTGAGISCNAGIPDFRSDNGLYNKKLKENESKMTIKGKEMFDISVYRSIETIRLFNQFIFSLYKQISRSTPTITHEFIKKLQDKKKLIKCYTQNIDGLERECGLSTEFSCDEWNNTNVIQLHGDLHQLCCNSCKHNYRWDEIYDEEGRVKCQRTPLFSEDRADAKDGRTAEDEGEEDEEDTDEVMQLSQNTSASNDSVNSIFSMGGVDQKSESSLCEVGSREVGSAEQEQEDDDAGIIECPRCTAVYESRVKLGKRSLESSIGIIRPNIVLYGEEHPYSEKFAKNLNKDLNRRPNLLLIFGTSLKVSGVKNLVKKMSKKIHENEKGLVVLVNKDPISNSFWRNHIDYQIVSDCDAFCKFVEGNLPNVFGQ